MVLWAVTDGRTKRERARAGERKREKGRRRVALTVVVDACFCNSHSHCICSRCPHLPAAPPPSVRRSLSPTSPPFWRFLFCMRFRLQLETGTSQLLSHNTHTCHSTAHTHTQPTHTHTHTHSQTQRRTRETPSPLDAF